MAEEIELKLICGEGFSLDELFGRLREIGEIGPGAVVRHRDTYLDTPGRALARAGLSGRCRREDGRARVDLKPVPIKPDLVMRRAELSRVVPEGEEPGAVLRALVEGALPIRLEATPVEQVVVDTERERFDLRGAGLGAELALDRVTAIGPGGERAASFAEIELELADGDPEAFRAVADRLASLPGVSASSKSKHARALELLGLPGFEYAPPAPKFTAADPARRVARAVGWALLAAIRGHEPGTRIGLDVEQLHKMRVATRRLRAALSSFRAIFGEGGERVREELAWLAGVLGAVRDLDVHLLDVPGWRRRFGAAPEDGWRALEEDLEARRVRAREALLEALDSPRYLELCERAARLFADPEVQADLPVDPGPTIAEVAAELLARRSKGFRRAAAAFEDRPTPERAHEVRIAGKKLRYTTEVLLPILPPELVEQLDRLSELQDVLGRYQDGVAAGMLAERLRDDAFARGADGAYLYVLGLLLGWTVTSRELVAPQILPALEELEALEPARATAS